MSNAAVRDLPLKFQSDEEVQRQFDNVSDLLTLKSFGCDDEARYDLMEERSKLFQELKRRRVPGY